MIRKYYLDRKEIVKTNLYEELRTARYFLKLNYSEGYEVVRCYSKYDKRKFLGYAIKLSFYCGEWFK